MIGADGKYTTTSIDQYSGPTSDLAQRRPRCAVLRTSGVFSECATLEATHGFHGQQPAMALRALQPEARALQNDREPQGAHTKMSL
eukprot:2938820-Pyramimonas_sp.AAC.1